MAPELVFSRKIESLTGSKDIYIESFTQYGKSNFSRLYFILFLGLFTLLNVFLTSLSNMLIIINYKKYINRREALTRRDQQKNNFLMFLKNPKK